MCSTHGRVWIGCAPRFSLKPDPAERRDLAEGGEVSVLTAELRAAGCVFAEEEAAILLEAAAADTGALDAMLARRIAAEPLEQIVGWVDFAGHRLTVAPGVFVPRQRTVLLAEHTIRELRTARSSAREVATGAREAGDSARQAASGAREAGDSARQAASGAREAGDPVVLVEAFCGIGPVASTVARVVPGTIIHLGDQDRRALECARANVGPGAGVHRLDCLHGLPPELAGRVDVICAVPPYVPETAREFLPREAADHESPGALFGGADGLDWVRRLIAESRDWLRPGGTVLIEIGHGQTETAAAHARSLGFTTGSHLGEDEQTVTLKLRR